ncbi:QueT transporter family protein [Clostridium pasteurianum]|uniref:Putative membrane protein n=1 Tax=Clostridium pasteurianum BC1 TaxID=86416 RepID=R4KE59_CLOPA|nr:QueT transporter family protein [Clostridium pasteurianum]AGK98839.1 putative membrane protein [Clostridium pasteurianum BC1]
MKIFFQTKNLVRTAMVAALYGALTWALSSLSYGPIQFRLTEIMVLLAFIDSAYIPGLVLGCIIANIFSPMGFVDMAFGSFATLIAVFLISKTKNLFLATLYPTIANGIIIAIELYFILKLPFLLSFGEVALGEFIVVTCLGYPIFKAILKNKKLVTLLKFN